MATYNFSTVAGTIIGFVPGSDTLQFTGVSAAQLVFTQVGSDLRVGIGASYVTFSGVTYAQIASTNLVFADGSVFKPGTVGADTLAGSINNDYLDASLGGNDSLDAGSGADVIVLGAALNATDTIAGGTGVDELRVSGNYASSIAFGATTVTGIEKFVFLGGGTVRFTLNQAVLDTAAQTVLFDGTAMTQSDSLRLDGNALTGAMWVTSGAGADSLTGGAGNDTLFGGTGADTLLGGNGSDTLNGGFDADVMTGGAGNDRFTFELGSPRSSSSPTTIDTITDFATGDVIDLPGVNAINGFALVFNVTEAAFNYTGGSSGVQPGANAGDGFADVFWRNNTTAGRLEIWVDGNDDGQFSEQDLLIHLPNTVTGKTSISLTDFVDNFIAYRGTSAGELMNGNGGDNQIYALAGDDTVNGNDGNDLVLAGAGNDSATGGLGADSLHGGAGSDTLLGNDGADTLYSAGSDSSGPAVDVAGTLNWLYGGTGNDTLYGADGNDRLFGESEDDNLQGGTGNDSIEGGIGGDQLHGQDGNDTLVGGDGNDYIDGWYGNNSLFGGLGNDSILSYGGIDVIDAGDGDDVVNLLLTGAGTQITGGLGADRFEITYGGSVFATYGSLTQAGTARITDFNAAQGDLIVTGITSGVAGGAPLVWRGAASAGFTATVGQSMALAGSDVSDNRFLELWTVYDAVNNKTVLFMDRNRDMTVDSTDFRLEFTGNITLDPAAFSAGTFTVLAGTSGADTSTSPGLSSGNDLAFAFGGADTLDGGLGNDTLNGDAGNDSLAGGDGSDHVRGGAGNDSLAGGADNDMLQGASGVDTLVGGDGADTLYAEGNLDSTNGSNDADAPGTLNWMAGGTGNDTLYGGGGDDRLSGESEDDNLQGGTGNDSIEGGIGGDILYGQDGNDTLLGGDGNDALDGWSGSNSLSGGIGNDSILSYGGIDVVDGGDGDDVLNFMWTVAGTQLTGGLGADRFEITYGGSVFATTGSLTQAGTARITDFDAAQGDVLVTGIAYGVAGGAPLVWRGAAAAGFTATTGQSMALAGSDVTDNRFLELWTWYDAANNKTVLFMDRNRDMVVDASDFRLEFTGNIALDPAAFSTGTFTVLAGTSGADTNTAPGLTTGNDLAFAFAGNDTLNGLAGNDTLNGDAGNDSLVGGDGVDHLRGGTGNDVLNGGLDNDMLQGASGVDTLVGGDGLDTLYAEGNLDSTNGSNDADAAGTLNWMYGGAGNDTAYGGTGNDRLFGEGDDDNLQGGAGNDSIDGGIGGDQLHGQDGNDTLVGGEGNDYIDGWYGNNSLSGGLGNDSVLSYGGVDTVNGGDGDDTLNFLLTGAGTQVTGGLGADKFEITYGGSVFANYGTLSVAGTARITDFNAAEGDRIVTGIGSGVVGGAPLIWRGAAAAGFTASIGESLTLAGSDGSDTRFLELWTVYDAGSNTTVLFMDRNRNLVVDAADFRLEFTGNIALDPSAFSVGTFTVLGGTSGADNTTTPALTSGSDLAFAFGGNDTLNGLAGNDTLNGDAGNDNLVGGDGFDHLRGGAGNDVLSGGTGSDMLQGAGGVDTLVGGDEADTLYAEGNLDSTNGSNDVDAAGTLNWLYGGAGNDTQYGGSGDDRLFGEADDDNLQGSIGNDRLDGGDGNDALYGQDGNDTLLGGAGNDNIDAWFGNNLVQGGLGNDSILSYGGVDTIDGGEGDDSINVLLSGGGVVTGGLGADSFVLTYGGSHFTNYGNLTMASTVLITDFNAAEGDRLISGFNQAGGFALPTVWRGAAAAGFTATIGQSLALAGSNTANTGMLEFWTTYNAATNTTVLFLDRNLNFVVDSADFRLEFTGNIALDAASFSAGTFVSTLGSDATETMTGTASVDVLLAIGGNDNVSGLAGNDTLMGGRGNDTVDGGIDNDALFGGSGGDSLLGGDGHDQVFGGTGGDIVRGGLGNDQLHAAGYENASVEAVVDAFGTTNALYGDDGNDTLYGNNGDDLLDGGGDADEVYGYKGDDTLLGGGNNDLLRGDQGADSLDGGTGIDSLHGESDDDRVLYDGADTVVDGGTEVDTLVLLTGEVVDLANLADQVAGGGTTINFENVDAALAIGAVTVSGNASENLLIGSAHNDTLAGNAGNDTLDGGAGVDSLTGGDGDDTYYINSGSDVVVETNADALTGGVDLVVSSLTGNVVLGANVENLRLLSEGAANGYGNALANVLFAGNGSNTLNGGAGIDTASYRYATAGVTLSLALSTAQATGGSGSDTLLQMENLEGSAFNDTLTGNALANRLDGGDGNDVLDGGAGNDTMDGGTGNDTYRVDAGSDVVEESGAGAAGGVDLVLSTASVTTLGANIENLRILSTGAANGIGNALDNLIYAGSGNNVINGGAGSDTVSYVFATAGITATLALVTAQATGGSGTDTLASIENLFGSNFADALTGNVHANTLNGGVGDDTLDGGGGADKLYGGAGSDTYVIDSTLDVVTETDATVAGGIDTVLSSLAATTLGANVENLHLTSTGAANGTGNTLGNLIVAGAGSNVLNGLGGIDTVSYADATAGVNVSLSLLTAQVTGGSGTDTLLNFENLVGSAFADQLRGSSAANAIDGGDGNDWMFGGAGQDVLTGGIGADVFAYTAITESTNALRDTITDFAHADGDRINLVNIDADAVLAGNQAFTFIGSAAFGANATGQLRYEAGVIYGSVDADADAEFAIVLTGAPALVAADFVL